MSWDSFPPSRFLRLRRSAFSLPGLHPWSSFCCPGWWSCSRKLRASDAGCRSDALSKPGSEVQGWKNCLQLSWKARNLSNFGQIPISPYKLGMLAKTFNNYSSRYDLTFIDKDPGMCSLNFSLGFASRPSCPNLDSQHSQNIVDFRKVNLRRCLEESVQFSNLFDILLYKQI